MNIPHFRAFVWLRWRLFANQLTRGGIFSQILLGILAVGAVFGAIGLLILSFLAGLLLMPEASPLVVLLVWDGLVISFLFNWCLGLVTELQRSEALSLDRFLHLPVSLSGVFALNYLSSLVCLTMLLFVPALVGLSLGMTLGKGPVLALQLPAAFAFLFMVTALSYQFQGWLASLMVNKRRRRTIIVVVSLVFILIFQAPNLVNLLRPWNTFDVQHKEETDKLAELGRALQANEITKDEYQTRRTDMQRERDERDTETSQSWRNIAWIMNIVVPIGWLPWGAAAAMDGNPLPGLLATVAYTLIGAASMWRAYRTTLRMYTGQFTVGTNNPAASQPAASSVISPIPAGPATFLEMAIPWLSEQAAAVALSGLRSLSCAGSEDAADLADHRPGHSRRHVFQRQAFSRGGAARAGIRRDGDNPVHLRPARRQSVRLRPQRLSHFRPEPGPAPGDSAWQKPLARAARFRPRRPGRRPGDDPHAGAVRPVIGDSVSVRVDVLDLLHGGQCAVDPGADAGRGRVPEADHAEDGTDAVAPDVFLHYADSAWRQSWVRGPSKPGWRRWTRRGDCRLPSC